MRPKELGGRPGKQTDGCAKTREVKLCTTWSAESRDEEGLPIRYKGSVPYSAVIESVAALDTDAERSEFAERVLREATRRGCDRAARRAILGDCASWIWNTAKELFPSAIQIADRYHAKNVFARSRRLFMVPPIRKPNRGPNSVMTNSTQRTSTPSSKP
jgi:transposase